MTRLLSTTKVGKIIDKSPRWVKRNLLDTGKLKATRFGREFRVSEADLEAFIGAMLATRKPNRRKAESEIRECEALLGL